MFEEEKTIDYYYYYFNQLEIIRTEVGNDFEEIVIYLNKMKKAVV